MWCDFLNVTPRAQATKERTDKLDFVNIKTLCSVTDTGKTMKRLGDKPIEDAPDKMLFQIYRLITQQ